MALLIAADGATLEVFPPDGRPAFTLPELQQIVGGYIELIPMRDPSRVMFVNEDGKSQNLPLNQVASALGWEAGIAPDDYIVGDVVVCTRIEAGYELE